MKPHKEVKQQIKKEWMQFEDILLFSPFKSYFENI